MEEIKKIFEEIAKLVNEVRVLKEEVFKIKKSMSVPIEDKVDYTEPKDREGDNLPL